MAEERKPRFEKTFCSQCGGEFGPGDHGYSHCDQHRPEKVKVWHDPEWTCLLVDDCASRATVSLTRLEAETLRQKLVPPEAVQPWDSHGDGGETERLHNLSAGHVLTEQDALDLQNLLADWNDEMGRSTNIWHDGRLAAYREIGGDEMVALVQEADNVERRRLAKRAIAMLEGRLAERRAAIKRATEG